MASKGTIGGKIVLEGEKAYNDALKSIRSEQKELRSEMKLCQSEFKSSQNSMEALTQKSEILTKQVDVQAKKVDVYTQAMESSAQKQEKAAEKVASLKEALTAAEKEMDELKDSSDDNSEAIKSQTQVIEDLKEKLSLAEDGYTKAEEKTKSYKTQVNSATAELNTLQGELDETNKYLKEAQSSTNNCAASIDEYGKQTDTASTKTNVFGDVLKANLASEVILEGVKKLANGIKEIADSAVEAGSEFESSMSQVAATMGMTSEEINAGSREYKLLEDAAKECGATTMYSASEAAEALNYLALAGYDAEKSAETLPKVLNLAAAGGLDLATASDLVTDSMAALGLETSQLDNYIDQMAKTAQKSNTSVSQLGEATLVCGGTVSLTKQSIETMNAELGILANNGIKSAEGGTHLRNVLLALSAPTDTAAMALEDLGIQVNDSSGEMRDLNDILTDMNEAMSQMSSSKKTQIISQIFNKTDISAVNALLKGTGDEFDDLVAELKSCTGAAEDMAATMNNNLKGKVTILKSALEGLGITAYDVFDEEMKNVVDGATKAVGRLQTSIEDGDLGVSLNKLANSLGDFCEKALDVGEDALPVLIDGLSWVIDHADLVTSGIVGIKAATFEMKTVEPVIKAASTAWEAYKVKNEGATIQQWLFNAAVDANPVGILITAITGLTAAVAAYVIINKDELTALDATSEKTKELVEETKSLNEEYAGNALDRRQTRDDLVSQATVAKQLSDELSTLAGKTKKTQEEQTRMKMIVDQLNEAFPDLNLAIDEQTGELSKSTSEIEKNIDALMAQAKVEAAREDLTKIAEEQYEAEKRLAELQEQEQEQAKVRQDTQDRLNDQIKESIDLRYDLTASYTQDAIISSMQAEATAASDAYDEIQASITETQATIDALGDEYAETMQYIDDNTAAATDATSELGDAAADTASDISDMGTEVSDAFETMYSSVSETVQSQIDLFSEYKSEASLTTEELLNNMQSQVDAVKNWADNMETLAERGIDQGLLEHLANLGPQGASYVSTFVEMSEEELQKAGDLYEKAMTLPDETAEQIATAYENAGKKSATSYGSGVSKSENDVKKITKKFGENAYEEIEDMPSAFEDVGKESATDFKKAIDKSEKEVRTSTRRFGKNALDEIEDVPTSFQKVGKQAAQGFQKGMDNSESTVRTSSRKLGLNAYEELGSALETHSPSKKTEKIGEYTGQGLALGINNSRQTVISAIDSICSQILSEGKNKITITDWQNIGINIPEGMAQGIQSGTNKVTAAVQAMASKALDEAKKELEINSPSKKFEYYGEMSGEGYVEGWEESTADIDSVIAEANPETSMGSAGKSSNKQVVEGHAGRSVTVNQEIKIYAAENDPIETAKKLKEAQREAAAGW